MCETEQIKPQRLEGSGLSLHLPTSCCPGAGVLSLCRLTGRPRLGKAGLESQVPSDSLRGPQGKGRVGKGSAFFLGCSSVT